MNSMGGEWCYSKSIIIDFDWVIEDRYVRRRVVVMWKLFMKALKSVCVFSEYGLTGRWSREDWRDLDIVCEWNGGAWSRTIAIKTIIRHTLHINCLVWLVCIVVSPKRVDSWSSAHHIVYLYSFYDRRRLIENLSGWLVGMFIHSRYICI